SPRAQWGRQARSRASDHRGSSLTDEERSPPEKALRRPCELCQSRLSYERRQRKAPAELSPSCHVWQRRLPFLREPQACLVKSEHQRRSLAAHSLSKRRAL